MKKTLFCSADTYIFREDKWSKIDVQTFENLHPAKITKNEENTSTRPSRPITASDWNEYTNFVKERIKMLTSANKTPQMLLKLIEDYEVSAENFPALHARPISQLHIKNNREPKKLLICITGHRRQLNMPIPLFHSKAWNHYDGIAYFFSKSKNFYNGEEDFVESQIMKLVELFRPIKLDLIATSGGGPLGMLLNNRLITGKKLIASPPVLRNDRSVKMIESKDYEPISNAKILFCSTAEEDSNHYQYMKTTLPACKFTEIVLDVSCNYKKHSTLLYALQSGILTDFMKS